MQPPETTVPNPAIAAYVGIDWADQKPDVILCPQTESAVLEHQVIIHSHGVAFRLGWRHPATLWHKRQNLGLPGTKSRCADLSLDGLRVL
jgi:hypothetical protein